MPFKHILVGIADDDASTEALHGAARLAGVLGAELSVAHAADHAGPYDGVQSVVRARIAAALEGTRIDGDAVTRDLVVRRGAPEDVLLEVAEERGADLIVVGPHRRHRLDFGSTAKRLMSHGTTPTWIQVGAPREHGAILAPLDLTPGSRETVRVAHDLARSLGSRLVLLHCYQGPAFAYESGASEDATAPTYVVDAEREREQAEFEAFVAGIDHAGVEVESVFVEDDPARHILDRQSTVDLIVVGRHAKRGVFGSLGSLSSQLPVKVECPLLIIPHRDE